jgi:hypothetical protein
MLGIEPLKTVGKEMNIQSAVLEKRRPIELKPLGLRNI